MSTPENTPEKLPVNPQIEEKVSKESIESLRDMLMHPEKELTEKQINDVKTLLKVADEVLGEDNFTEPLGYLASTRQGLRESDMAALLGEEWDKEKFLAQTACFGIPLAFNVQEVCLIPSMQLKAILLSTLSEADRKSFQEDIAYHLLGLPEQDPARMSELLFHLMQAGLTKEAAAHFGKVQGAVLTGGADLIGSCFISGEAGEKIIGEMLDYEGNERFDLYRHFINEVFTSLMQNTPVPNAEKLVKLIEAKLQGVMGERNTIDNIELLALNAMRIASVHLRRSAEMSVQLTPEEAKQPEEAINKLVEERRPAVEQAKQAELKEVEKYFNMAVGLIDRLMAQNPPVSAFRRDNIDAIFNLGMIAIDMRQPKAAERCYDIAFPIIEGKIAESDDAFEWKLYYASWFVTVCRVFQQVGDKALLGKYFEKGKKALKEAIKLKGEFAAKHPEMMQVQHDLMVMYNDFADLSHANGLDEDAVSYYDNALAISGRLADAHKDQVAVAILPSICLERLGRLYRDKKDLKKAGEYFAQSLEARKKLAEKNPQDVRLLHDLATANNNMAALYADAADKAPAEDYLIGQLDALTKVNQLQPNEASVANVLDAIIALGDYYFITEKGKEALHTYQQALKVIEPLRSRQVSEQLLNRIAGVHYKCGMSQISLKEEKVGRDNLNIASQLWHQLLQATGNPLYKKEFDEAQKELNKFN